MKPRSKTYVLDANAILDYVEDGPGAATTQRLLREALRSEAALISSVMNLGEVFYLLWKNKGEQKARHTIDDLLLLPLQVVPVDLSHAIEAAALKAVHKLPYADSIAAALAMRRHATLVSSDRDFEKLGRRIPILWLSRP